MNKQTKLKKIIAAYNPYPWSSIDLSKTIKDTYVANEFKADLAQDICERFSLSDAKCTKLNNDLFGSIKTGDAILTLIG